VDIELPHTTDRELSLKMLSGTHKSESDVLAQHIGNYMRHKVTDNDVNDVHNLAWAAHLAAYGGDGGFVKIKACMQLLGRKGGHGRGKYREKGWTAYRQRLGL